MSLKDAAQLPYQIKHKLGMNLIKESLNINLEDVKDIKQLSLLKKSVTNSSQSKTTAANEP